MVARHPTRADLEQALHDPSTSAWWCLPPGEGEGLTRTSRRLGLDALAVEDLLDPGESPKLDRIGHSLVVIAATAGYDTDQDDLVRGKVSVLLDHQVLVLIADSPARERLTARLDAAEDEVLAGGIAAALHLVCDEVVDSYTATVETLQTRVDALSESLFDDRPLRRQQQLQAFRMRRALSQLRRVVAPVRDITAALAGAAAVPDPPAAGRDADATGREATGSRGDSQDLAGRLLDASTARRFADVADHAAHALQATDGLREVLSSAFETNLALADVHLNVVMKKLSSWAAIIAVPTLVTGFMGMNVPYPGNGTWWGFVVSAVVMVALVLGLYVGFKRSDWL
nr:CorA family divalent cation transporter [Nakamurella flavida]